ncbi:phospholipase effector Tle1 domain-containing protein [Marinobacter salinexigens]|uniref:phospholipase effector Tle1 domain-containing protein n=1 Tax=Marinobacter salinexigens TaxID=2919747 RepID=UPI00165F8638|nr:DUF2235 domain-containing protein [Marinobacter salinexigens]
MIDKLSTGHFCLVYSGIGSDTPRCPAVCWQTSTAGSDGGRWQSGLFGDSIPGLENTIETLNRKALTPADLEQIRSPGRCDGPNPGSTVQKVGDHSGPSDHKQLLPLGAAASVLPVAAAAMDESKPDEREGVHIVLGLFTDGTLNNVDNIEAFRRKLMAECVEPAKDDPSRLEECRDRLAMRMGESYANAPTNVVKLFDLYKEGEATTEAKKTLVVKAYQPGAGTKSGDNDSIIGMATGLGQTGVPAQVAGLFSEAAIRISDIAGRSRIESLTVDLFGFSRGAAAARHAVNEILRGRGGGLADALSRSGLAWPAEVKIRFVGLFDTVAGIVNPQNLDLSPGNDRNSPVELFLNPEKVEQAVHLVASDEKRANFSLNSIKSSEDSIADNFREISLPGAHSDIGGGYQDLMTEDLLLYPMLSIRGTDVRWPEQTVEWDNLEALRARVESEGWIGAHSMNLPNGNKPSLGIERERDEHPLPDGRVDLRLRMQRMVRGEYSRLSLRLMYHLAAEANAPFYDIDETDESLVIPEDLIPFFGWLMQKNASGELELYEDYPDAAMLRQRYMHHSDHFNLTEFLIGDMAAAVEFPVQQLHPFRPALSRERAVYFNNGVN